MAKRKKKVARKKPTLVENDPMFATENERFAFATGLVDGAAWAANILDMHAGNLFKQGNADNAAVALRDTAKQIREGGNLRAANLYEQLAKGPDEAFNDTLAGLAQITRAVIAPVEEDEDEDE